MADTTTVAPPQTPIQTFRQWATLIMGVIAALMALRAERYGVQLAPPPPVTVPGTYPQLTPPAPAPAPKAPAPIPALDPHNAVVKIQFGNAGCSATIVGPQRSDGRYDLLTANHCMAGQPRDGIAKLRDGRSFSVTLVSTWKGPDIAWIVTTVPVGALPYTELADTMPAKGDKVWHCGYGIDKPGNRENGEVITPDNGSGKTEYSLSVSSGDSGGGILLDSSGKVLSPVCCTTSMARKASMYGGTLEQVRLTRPSPVHVQDDWSPIDLPVISPQ